MTGVPVFLAVSPVLAAYGVAGGFLLFRAWRGWRLGPVRQGLGLVALALAVGVGVFFGSMAGPLFQPLGLPDPVLGLCGGLMLGLCVYIGLLVFAAILFKNTEDQSFALVRLGYGLAGMAMGLAVGVFFLGVAVVGVRVSGAVLEGRQRVGAAVRSADWVVELRTGLEQGLLGGVLRALDPVSEEAYGLFLRAGQVSGTPGGVQRFLANPEWRRVIGDRRAWELQRDPVLMRQILEGRWMEVLRNPRVLGMLNDREVRRQLGAVDLEKALDYAVPKTEKGAARARPRRP